MGVIEGIEKFKMNPPGPVLDVDRTHACLLPAMIDLSTYENTWYLFFSVFDVHIFIV